MSYKFNDEDKQVREGGGKYFGFGVHRVKLLGATASETEAGKEFIEIAFCDPDDEDKADVARVWFVGGASNISFNTLRQIVVHNAKTDADKSKAGEAVDRVADSDALADILNSKTVGGELWFTKYQDPNRNYVDARGVTRQSVNKNIYGYEPRPREDLMPVKDSETVEGFPINGKPASEEEKANIPTDWK